MSVKFTSKGLADGTDDTKELEFNVAGVTTGTTRTITVPNGDTKLYTGDGTSGQILTSNGAGTAPTFQAAAAGGKVLQVVSGIDSVNKATTAGAIDGHSVSITPSSANSKILMLLTVAGETIGSGGDRGIGVTLYRGSTLLVQYTYNHYMSSNTNQRIGAIGIQRLDSPNTTAEVTYKYTFQQTGANSQARVNYYGESSIILMEIAQ